MHETLWWSIVVKYTLQKDNFCRCLRSVFILSCYLILFDDFEGQLSLSNINRTSTFNFPAVVDRRIYTRIFQFPLRINVKISEHAQNFNVFKPRLVCRRILILPSGSSGNSQKSEILKNLKFSKIRNSQKSEILKNLKFSKIWNSQKSEILQISPSTLRIAFLLL